ncbi:hypothetical protein HOP52_11940 [Halomonas campisalis]|uniref:Uncharacterized protein n=1 Tax=Billgrantia campisalis TaxID=74661 RepID=A0ABS9P9P6_9GAMM|nr:hypothetical protein [Halomonas campisalis]MCG6658464.1 hypothetical protein [Halomonas campisalis]MDR5863324.1 hypothetical protein [Halomonas campisalis]
MADSRHPTRSPFLQALAVDESLPLDPAARQLWLADLERPSRWWLQPPLQALLGVLLHLIWFVKRLPLPQFRAHGLLQRWICAFCARFVSPEANLLILRHFATESNVLNFLVDNGGVEGVEAVTLYPRRLPEMLEASFVEHDQALFRAMRELGGGRPSEAALAPDELRWEHWRPIEMADFAVPRRRTQVLDFESAHALFMCLFCLLLTREEYRDAINGFSLDHAIAIRIGRLIGDPTLPELAYNKYPHYLVGPGNLGQRFLMHGFFTEYLYARLERLRSGACPPSNLDDGRPHFS